MDSPSPAPPPSDESLDKGRTKMFRKRSTATRLAPEIIERQGRIARIAFEAMGREAATGFLNGVDQALGGRPLDIAMESESGLSAVAAAISALPAR